MGAEEIINVSTELMPEILLELGQLGVWLQAIGAIALLWLIFQVVSLIIRVRQNKFYKEINEKIDKLDRKLNRVLKKNK